MAYLICNLTLFLCIFPLWIQCQSGSFLPLTGQIDTLDSITYVQMISELDCVSVCLEYTSPSCYGISYESFRQECHLITESIPSSYVSNQSLLNWHSYIRINN